MKKALSLIESLSLKGYEDEQEEYASIVTDGSGNIWTYAQRRIHSPQNGELISAFYFDGINWVETDPVTKSAGMDEAPATSYACNGIPITVFRLP